MLFIPIDVLNKKFSLLKHLALIMLHDYLHCLVFKEQSCLALLSKHPSLQATHLSYRIQISLSRTFLISFFKFFEPSQRLASQGFATLFCVRICQRLVLYYTSFPYMSTPFLKKI